MKTQEKKTIENLIHKGLKEPNFDLGVDYAEMFLDTLLDDEVIRNIPIVKTIVGAVKGGIAIREVFLAKKILTFLKEFHSGQLDNSKKEAFLGKLNSNPKFKEKVVEQVTILNDRFISVKKSVILSNLFKAHINDKFGWEEFCELGEHLDDMHTRAFDVLKNTAESDNPFKLKSYEPEKDGGGVLLSSGLCVIHGNHYSINTHGQYLYFYGILGDINFSFPNKDEN